MAAAPQGPPPVPAAAAAMAALGATALFGARHVDPLHTEWLMRGDFALHFLGWHLYRTSPWTLPLGATPHLIWPVGSSVGLTDSIPLASALFKLLDPLLPPTFQFIGIWLVTCFALQGLFGALLMRLVTPHPGRQLCGALLFVLSPPLAIRFGHAALAAHWVLLAALWLSLSEGADRPSWRRVGAWALLAGVTATIQPYLLLMVALLMLAAFGRPLMIEPRQFVRAAAHAALGLGASWLGLWQSGSLIVPSAAGLTMGGFGGYSANLLTFIMPTEANTWLFPGPIRYASPPQYEGYAYLGLGLLMLALGAIVGGLVSRWRPAPGRLARHVPLALALVVLTALALGPTVTAGARVLWSYDERIWGPLTTFRSSGRMIWPLYYATVTAILFAVARSRHRTATLALAIALAVQAGDLSGMVPWIRTIGDYGYRDPLVSPVWTVAPRHYQRVVVVPSNLCAREGVPDLRPFLLLAGRERLAINAGATARYDRRRAAEYCGELARDVAAGLRGPDALYVMAPDVLPSPASAGDRVCGVADGVGVCVSAASYAQWRDEAPLALR